VNDTASVPDPTSPTARGGTAPHLIGLFVVNAVSQYAGASLAVRAFGAMPAAGVAWIRVLTGALVLGAWRRPWRELRHRERDALLLVVAFGIALAAMNLTFYLAIERLPLGTTVAIEFIGPILVAAIAVRGLRNLAALLVAMAGVAMLSKISVSGSALGVGLALAAGMFWAVYIVLAHQVARRGLGMTGLAAAMAVGTVAIAPLAAAPAVESAGHGAVLLLAVGAGLLSSVIPYALDQVLLRRLSRGAFALLLSMLPATATVKELIEFHRFLFPEWDMGLERQLRDRFSMPSQARINTLSKGQARQVALLCAVCHRPELLLLDEPAGGLDPAARREFLETAIQLLNREGSAILFSSHQMSDVERIGARVVLIERGKVCLDRDLARIREDFCVAMVPRSALRDAAVLERAPGCLRVRSSFDSWHAVFERPPEEVSAELQELLGVDGVRCVRLPLEDLFVEMVGAER